MPPVVLDPVTDNCLECKTEVAPADLRLELTYDDEPLTYCVECWEREFGESSP